MYMYVKIAVRWGQSVMMHHGEVEMAIQHVKEHSRLCGAHTKDSPLHCLLVRICLRIVLVFVRVHFCRRRWA